MRDPHREMIRGLCMRAKEREMSGDQSQKIAEKRDREKKVIGQMIAIYCHKKHGRREGLCPDCQQLFDYAQARSRRCPFMETKTFCSACEVHCYEPKMRDKIREIMRYSGPRMLLYHPLLLLKHMLTDRIHAFSNRAEKKQSGR